MPKTHTIQKGQHRSDQSWFPRFHFHRNGIEKHEVTFHKDSEYDLKNSNQFDINKLFGISYGLHHNNSARFGWRWDLRKNMVEILAYVYVDGKRINETDADDIHICWVHVDVPYKYSIITTDEEFFFSVTSTKDSVKAKSIRHSGKLRSWGYMLNFYFGGDETAPHDMHITIGLK